MTKYYVRILKTHNARPLLFCDGFFRTGEFCRGHKNRRTKC